MIFKEIMITIIKTYKLVSLSWGKSWSNQERTWWVGQYLLWRYLSVGWPVWPIGQRVDVWYGASDAIKMNELGAWIIAKQMGRLNNS